VPTAATLVRHQSWLSDAWSNGQYFLPLPPALSPGGQVNTLALIHTRRSGCNRRERNAGLSATGAWIRIAVGEARVPVAGVRGVEHRTFVCSECHVTEHRLVFIKDGPAVLGAMPRHGVVRFSVIRSAHQHENPPHALWLLRTRSKGPRSCCCTPEERDEFAAGRSMTSSARASSVAGTSSPSAFAVFRLITSSYRISACTEVGGVEAM
jgi:hypothetical protein